MKQSEPTQTSASRLPEPGKRNRRAIRRRLLDLGWYGLITLAGVSVIAALLAIFIYLLSEVVPLFKPVSAELKPWSAASQTAGINALPPVNSVLSAETAMLQFAETANFPADFQLVDALQRYVVLAKHSGEACLLQLNRQLDGCVQRLSLTDRTVDLTAAIWLAGQQSLINEIFIIFIGHLCCFFLLINGMPLADFYSFTTMGDLDRVETSSGATGFLFGGGRVGG